jgi:hypothetical protein
MKSACICVRGLGGNFPSCLKLLCRLTFETSPACMQISTELGVAVPAEREDSAWSEGVAIWVAVLVVSLVGECHAVCLPAQLLSWTVSCAMAHMCTPPVVHMCLHCTARARPVPPAPACTCAPLFPRSQAPSTTGTRTGSSRNSTRRRTLLRCAAVEPQNGPPVYQRAHPNRARTAILHAHGLACVRSQLS